MSRASLRKGIVALLALGLLGGCGGDMSDLRDYVAKIKARTSSDIEPIPQIKPYEPYTYVGGNLRDPFMPLTPANAGPERSTSSLSPDFVRNREPLEEFPLDAMRMAGTFRIAGATYALIKAPDGIVHRVRTGDHMGQNFGQVVAIEDTEVRLVEIVPDGLGGYMKRDAAIAVSE
jgi:type IV pilus assembly protein PilP